jgi:hypothetical protein
VALIPALAGISGTDYDDPVAFSAGFRTAMMICAGLLVAGAVLSAVLLRPRPSVASPTRFRTEDCPHCGVSAPQQHPG